MKDLDFITFLLQIKNKCIHLNFLEKTLEISHLLQVLIKTWDYLSHYFQAGQHLEVIYTE